MFHFSSAFLVPSDEARLGDGTVDIVISYNALIESELAALLCLAFVAWSRDKANIISSNRNFSQCINVQEFDISRNVSHWNFFLEQMIVGPLGHDALFSITYNTISHHRYHSL